MGQPPSIVIRLGIQTCQPFQLPGCCVPLAHLFSCLGVGLFYVINTYASTVFYGPSRMLGFVAVGNSNPWQDVLARDAWGAAGFVHAPRGAVAVRVTGGTRHDDAAMIVAPRARRGGWGAAGGPGALTPGHNAGSSRDAARQADAGNPAREAPVVI